MFRTLLLCVLLVLAACSSGDEQQPLAVFGSSGSSDGAGAQNIAQEQPPSAASERIILRSASLTLAVDDPQTKLESISHLAVERGGWVVNSTVRSGQSWLASIQIRVPAEQFDAIIAFIKADVLEVESELVTGQDVTQEYTDLNSRLINLEAAEAQLQTLMEDAEDTEAVLNVYNELVRIRGEIETVKGRINYFNESASFASITAELHTVGNEAPSDTGWNPGDTVENAIKLLGDILRVLIDVFILLVVVGIPLLIIGGIPVWLLYRLLRRQPQQQNLAPASEPDEDINGGS